MKRIAVIVGIGVGVCGILFGVFRFVFGDVPLADVVDAPAALQTHIEEFEGHTAFCDEVHEQFRHEQMEQTKILYEIKGKLGD
jgi:hypothetical protein